MVFLGGVRGFFGCIGYNEIRSMSGQYASYWNAFLLSLNFFSLLAVKTVKTVELVKNSKELELVTSDVFIQ